MTSFRTTRMINRNATTRRPASSSNCVTLFRVLLFHTRARCEIFVPIFSVRTTARPPRERETVARAEHTGLFIILVLPRVLSCAWQTGFRNLADFEGGLGQSRAGWDGRCVRRDGGGTGLADTLSVVAFEPTVYSIEPELYSHYIASFYSANDPHDERKFDSNDEN